MSYLQTGLSGTGTVGPTSEAAQAAFDASGQQMAVVVSKDGKTMTVIPITSHSEFDAYAAQADQGAYSYVGLLDKAATPPGSFVDEHFTGVSVIESMFTIEKLPWLLAIGGVIIGGILFYRKQAKKRRGVRRAKRARPVRKRSRPSYRRRTITTWF